MKTILLTIILITSSQTPTVLMLKDYMKYARTEFRQADVNLKISTIKKVREVRAQRLQLSTARYYAWYNWKSVNMIKGRVLVALPPAASNDLVVGLAPVCNPEGTAMVNFKLDTEVDRFRSELAFVHEIGHLLGATHQDGKNIMTTSVNREWGGVLPGFLDVSLEEIRSCQIK